MVFLKALLSALFLFKIMINDVFSNEGTCIEASLCNDGAIWKRERNVSHVIKSVQQAIMDVERWSID